MKNAIPSTPQNSTSILGLRVVTDQLIPEIVNIDQSFQKCPIAHAAGIPLYVKRLLDVPRIKHKNYIIVRMMSIPEEGLAAMDWQHGGMLPPAPIVLVARSDHIEFTIQDWKVLDDFQMEMLDDGPRKVTRKDFIEFVKKNQPQNKCNIVLQALYPKRSKCKAHGLVKNTELNDLIGIIVGMYQNGQVGVQFEGRETTSGVKPKNLTLIKQK